MEDLATVRRRSAAGVPIAADECMRSVDDARRLRSLEAADVVVLKVQPLGGVAAALAVAEAAGLPALVSSMFESSVGLAAGVALAAALPELPYACGLGSALLLAADVVADPLVPVDGWLPVRRVVPDPELLARFSVASVSRPGSSAVHTSRQKASGCSRWAAWPQPGRVTARALGPMAAAMRSPAIVNFGSSSPATSSTGICSSASRPHRGS